jgi:hypothetical protein
MGESPPRERVSPGPLFLLRRHGRALERAPGLGGAVAAGVASQREAGEALSRPEAAVGPERYAGRTAQPEA